MVTAIKANILYIEYLDSLKKKEVVVQKRQIKWSLLSERTQKAVYFIMCVRKRVTQVVLCSSGFF